jgi:hypothetical protein
MNCIDFHKDVVGIVDKDLFGIEFVQLPFCQNFPFLVEMNIVESIVDNIVVVVKSFFQILHLQMNFLLVVSLIHFQIHYIVVVDNNCLDTFHHKIVCCNSKECE